MEAHKKYKIRIRFSLLIWIKKQINRLMNEIVSKFKKELEPSELMGIGKLLYIKQTLIYTNDKNAAN